MTSELRAGAPFSNDLYERLTQRAILECHKWNLGAGDLPTICRYPVVVSKRLWDDLGDWAEALSRESDEAERELLARPELHSKLGLSKRVADCLRQAPWSDAPRYTRFDFHPTAEGFRITESNCDVAGGLLEASGVWGVLASLLDRPLSDDPAGDLASAFVRRFGAGARVGLAHLESYSEDRQVVLYLARRFEERGLRPRLFHPAQLRPGLQVAGSRGLEPLEALYRFIPGDWLEQLPDTSAWQELFHSGRVCNPLSTLLVQSKRFPLVWPELSSPLSTWRRFLPETREPGSGVSGSDAQWVLKPAFGHEGANVVIPGDSSSEVVTELMQEARRDPNGWATQRRFELSPLETPDGLRFACIGVFVVDGKRAGGYARLSTSPVIAAGAQEAAVFTEEP